ncbi:MULTISPECIES: beta-ketoacyl-[acyl-carrier-protein] synthase family protein [Sorangium]|uniref:Oxoacyl-(Acyl-carrier-protein) synthase II n=1 Tax=Sorangium cellulosum (strain So ce56) TaxID=448385 RepID=A9GBT0_SORC5|nr:beta-ketoacyl-[acyl-carrier-protein] synthase family protein [Sorangium cellulosum]CAN96086.1 oxoacyl-(acyl-carrier-protein) synthase II [Sorangium cellulosum So ce56]
MRIWVTGIGIVSPLGRGASETMDRLIAGERAFAPLSLFEIPGTRGRIAAEVRGLSPEEVAPPGEAEGWSRTDAMAVLSAREALGHAGIDPRAVPVDLVVGGTTAGMFETEDLLAWLSHDPSAIAPLKRMLSHPLSSTADHVRAAVGPFRRVRSVCSACSSGANAVLLGAAWLRAGLSTRVLAGGADGLCRLTYTGFGALAAVDPAPCRPFDRRRAGLNLGEAAAFLLLESEDAARARGAQPIVELRGWATGAEAHHITNPEREGRTAARVMRDALRCAALTPSDLDYVNAHGTATPLNDVMESAALRACLGPEVNRIAVSSSKGQIGHTLGAAGAVEAAITALAIARGVMPPTGGLEEVDPECQLAHLKEAREAPIRSAMSNSFGFGGTDSVLVLAQPDRFPPPLDAGSAPRRRSVVVTAAATIGPLGVLASRGGAAYLEPGPPPAEGAIAFNTAAHLDLARARRLDRAGRLTTAAILTALSEAGLGGAVQAEAGAGDPAADVAPSRTLPGAIVGASFGSVDASTAYMRRIYDKGAKYASPADFPNLVPSSPVGHASIYLGLRGPVFAMADLGATAEAAMVTAIELITAGEGEALAAGSVEETSPMIERCLGPICSQVVSSGVRSEGAAVLLFESAARVRERGARPVAMVSWWNSWRGDGVGMLAGAPAPARLGASGEVALRAQATVPSPAAVFVGREEERLVACLQGSPWAEVRRSTLASRSGDHEGAGGFAAAAAVAALASRDLASVLVVGGAPDRGYAILLVAPGDA